MADCPDCGEDHSSDMAELHKRAAEAVIAASSADRATMNERAKATLDDAREMWPEVSDDTLRSFFLTQAYLVETLSRMDVLHLSGVLDAVFSNCTLAAAALAGVYDLTDDDAPKRKIEDIVTESREREANQMEDLSPFPGNYL